MRLTPWVLLLVVGCASTPDGDDVTAARTTWHGATYEDVVAHYAEASRWEWERFLAADVVTEWERRRYFEVI